MAVRKPIAKGPAKPKTARQRLLAQVHIAKKELALDDATYLDILGGFGHESSGDMTDTELRKLVEHLKERGWKPKRPQSGKRNQGWGKNKYQKRFYRGEDYASPEELRTIEGMWARVSRASDKPAALRTFLQKRWKAMDITWLDSGRSCKIINVLKEMYWRKLLKEALKEWPESEIKRATREFLKAESPYRLVLYDIFRGHEAGELLRMPDEHWIHAIRVVFGLERI